MDKRIILTCPCSSGEGQRCLSTQIAILPRTPNHYNGRHKNLENFHKTTNLAVDPPPHSPALRSQSDSSQPVAASACRADRILFCPPPSAEHWGLLPPHLPPLSLVLWLGSAAACSLSGVQWRERATQCRARQQQQRAAVAEGSRRRRGEEEEDAEAASPIEQQS